MIYVDNDWYSNFSNAVNSNDERSVTGMVIDGISSVIAERRGELEELLKKVNVPIVNEPSNEQLSDAISQNLPTNSKLRFGLAYLIAKQNGILSGTQKVHSRISGNSKTKETPSKSDLRKKSRADKRAGKTPRDRKAIDWSKTADTVTAIAGSITAITDTIGRSKNSQNQFKTDLANLSNNKAPDYSGAGTGTDGTPPKKSKAWIWWLVGGVVASGVVFVLYKKGVFGGKK